MGTITNGHKKTMEEMGAGITRADEIDMTQENHFTKKWGTYLTGKDKMRLLCSLCLILELVVIQETCPWFFKMCELIGEHPNIVPSSLGNGNSEMDMLTFTDGLGATSEEEGEEKVVGSPTPWGIWNDESDPSNNEADEGEGDEDGGKPNKGKGKEKGYKEVPKLSRTGAKPGKSKPATRPAKENKRKCKADEFADIAEAEELTRQ
jgi:hypothetical protein